MYILNVNHNLRSTCRHAEQVRWPDIAGVSSHACAVQHNTSISTAAVEAAIDFVEVCCQHTAFLSGRGRIVEDLVLIEAGD